MSTSNTIDLAQAGQLQTAIQKKLAEYGYSEDSDNVMAEYVTVMLANSKTASQITAELSDLIGSDYDSAFTDWIFETAIPEHYHRAASSLLPSNTPTSAAAAAAPAAQTIASSPPSGDAAAPAATTAQQQEKRPDSAAVNTIQTVSDSRESSGRAGGRMRGFPDGPGLPQRPHNGAGPGQGQGQGQGGRAGGNAVFGNALAGLKRGPDSSSASDRQGNRRQRLSAGADKAAGFDGDRQQQQQQQGRSIFDRAGVRAGQFNNNNNQNRPGFVGGQAPQQALPAGGFPPIPGLPPLHIPDNFNSLPPMQQQAIQQQIFQHQLIAAAAAQQMFQPPGPPGPPGRVNPTAAPFVPHNHHQQQQQQQQQQAASPSPPKPVKLPSRPTSDELCKYGIDCKNAICKYAHPSPAATKESGLVLSKDVCDNGINCQDKDCPRAHVSPAQKTDPQGLNVHLYKQKSVSSSLSKPAAPAAASPSVSAASNSGAIQAANPGAKPCMFGAACTRPGCFFSHPQAAPVGNGIPCKFGLACTRPDCYFSHPPGHRRTGASASTTTASPSASSSYHHHHHHNRQNGGGNRSATFGAGDASTNGTTGNGSLEGKEDVKVDDGKMSARLKKFTEQVAPADRERIIPGSGGANVSPSSTTATAAGQADKQAGNESKDDLEVVM